MKNLYSLISLIVFTVTTMQAQQADTTYYDKNWRGVKFKALAQYIRYDFKFTEPGYENVARIFYINGQLEAEGCPLSVDKFDGNKSMWKNELIRYAPDGSKREVSFYNNIGQLNGKKTRWNDKGQMLFEKEYKQGLLNGISVEYPEDNPNICYVTNFNNEQPVNNESTLYFKNGRKVTVDYHTKQIKKVAPTLSDCRKTFKDGITSWQYDINGIYIALNFTKTNLYGNYYQCFIVFQNNTNDPIEINPANITGEYHKGDKTRPIELMSAEEYLSKIARSQAWSQALSGFASGMATYNAGYSTSTTNANVVGRGGWASGTATTTTFNAFERQAILDREQAKLNEQAKADKNIKEAIDGAALKRTTVEPGEQIVKSFYIKYLSADQLNIKISIDNTSYPFEMSKF